ncbi:MAG: glutathione S-transferase family protein [Hyphomicrobiaceae bacterium]
MLKLYGRANSSNVRKVLWTLDELGPEYERVDYGRGYAPTDTPEYRAINPSGLVPALRDGEITIGESNTIIRYLVRREKADYLLPPEPVAAAKIEQWMDWQSAEMVRPLGPLFIGGHLDMPPTNNPDEQTRALAQAIKLMSTLDTQLARTGAHVTGDNFTAADLAIGVHVHRWFALDIDRPEHAALTRYYATLSERPAYMTHVNNGLP